MENQDEEINRLRKEKARKNTTELIEKFKPEIQSEGCDINLVVLPGNVYQIEITGDISEALMNKINDYRAQFYTLNNLD